MLFADHLWIQHARGRVQRIHCRINAKLGDLARKYGSRIQVRERGRRRRISQVVGRNVNRLHRGDRTFVRRGDTFLHCPHIGCKRWLIAYRRRNAPKKRRYFRTCLRKAEYVIDEEEHVLAFLIAEIFSDGQTRKPYARTRSRRLVHLSINQRNLRFRRIIKIDNFRLDHFMIKVVPFTGTLTHAGEHGETTVRFRDVIDEFHDEYGFSYAGATEQTDFTTLCVRRKQVDDLNAGDQNFRFGRLIDKFRRFRVNRKGRFIANRTTFINRFANNIHDTTQRFATHRHGDRFPRIANFLAAG